RSASAQARPHWRSAGHPDGLRRGSARRSWRNLRLVTRFEQANLHGWDLDFLLITKREDEKRDECADEAHARHPPDVPDEREAGDDGEERIDEADRTVFRHLDRLVRARRRGLTLRGARALLGAPKGVQTGDA